MLLAAVQERDGSSLMLFDQRANSGTGGILCECRASRAVTWMTLCIDSGVIQVEYE